jgi:hypothetical protein
MVSPDGQNLDNFYLARTGADEVQLDCAELVIGRAFARSFWLHPD